MPIPAVAAVILAAGCSRRMEGANKLLASVGGMVLIRRAVAAALASRARPVIVVLGHQAELVAAALESLPVQTVLAAAYAEGMSASLRAGLAAVPESVAAALIALGDMPFVPTAAYDRLITAFCASGQGPICVPVHDQQRGHPVLWPRRFFSELSALSGDRGGRALLAIHADQGVSVPVPWSGVLEDIDSAEDLRCFASGGLRFGPNQ
ncbi:molybdenum cofactor cytidylyltransferase [uncultured Gammaproteobacteria bacterium]